MTGPVLWSLAAELGLSTTASTEDLRQMVHRKLVDLEREPRDVMVVVETEVEGPGRVRLHDGEREFLATVLLTTEQPFSSSEEDAHAAASTSESDDSSRDCEAALAAERDRLAADVERY